MVFHWFQMRDRLRFPDAPGDLLGAHISTRGGLATVFERAQEIDAFALAMFSKNSNQWKCNPLTIEELGAFETARTVMPHAPLLIHTSYLINLATTGLEFLTKSIIGMSEELLRAAELGSHAIVHHPGAHLGEGVEGGIDQIARTLDAIYSAIPDCNTITLLETSAGQGSCLGCSFEELGKIIARMDHKDKVGICFDTCHVFAAGYEIRTAAGYEQTIEELDRFVGLDRVGAFHLNDSKRELGSRVDRHEHIGDGHLGLDAFGFLLNDRRFDGVPKVLETPKPEEHESDRRNLRLLRSLVSTPDQLLAPSS